MRDLSEMPPTLRGWRVDLPPSGQDMFNRLFIEGYTFENRPDGSLIAHAPGSGGEVPRALPPMSVAPQRFDHSNWAALGATPAQTIQIQNNRLVTLADEQTDLRRVLGEFGWLYARHADGNWRAAPTQLPINMGTLADMTMPPPDRGPEVLFNWTDGNIPSPLPHGSRVEVRWRDTTIGSIMERRVVRERPTTQASFRREYQPLLREQQIGYLSVDGGVIPHDDTAAREAVRRQVQQAASEMDISRALDDNTGTRSGRGPRSERRPPGEMAAQGAIPSETPEQRRSLATAWLTNELRRRSSDPLQQDHKSFMVWAAEVYGEFMRRRDGEGNVQLNERSGVGLAGRS